MLCKKNRMKWLFYKYLVLCFEKCYLYKNVTDLSFDSHKYLKLDNPSAATSMSWYCPLSYRYLEGIISGTLQSGRQILKAIEHNIYSTLRTNLWRL